MTCHRLPRACGTIVKCDEDGCKEVSQTGQMFGNLHAGYLRTQGWLIRPAANQQHLCPEHGAIVAANIAASKERSQAKRLKRDANRRERHRRMLLTPEQRKAEDRQRAKDRRAAKRETATAAAAQTEVAA